MDDGPRCFCYFCYSKLSLGWVVKIGVPFNPKFAYNIGDGVEQTLKYIRFPFWFDSLLLLLLWNFRCTLALLLHILQLSGVFVLLCEFVL